METMKIKAILSAAKYKSLSRAAEDFSYTPSALSHMADSLEEELGVKLLLRTRTGVSLTEEGMLLAEKMDAVLRAENELIAAASEIGGEHFNLSFALHREAIQERESEHPRFHRGE